MHNERLDPSKDTKEFKEALNLGEFADGRPQQKLPEFMLSQGSAAQLTAFEDACFKTCEQITDLMGIGLEVEGGKDWFSKRHGKPGSCTTRLLHYPALPTVRSSTSMSVSLTEAGYASLGRY